MNLETKIKKLIQERDRIKEMGRELIIEIKKEIESRNIHPCLLSSAMGKHKSYVSKYLNREIAWKKWPGNFYPFLEIAMEIVNIKKKEKQLKKF